MTVIKADIMHLTEKKNIICIGCTPQIKWSKKLFLRLMFTSSDSQSKIVCKIVSSDLWIPLFHLKSCRNMLTFKFETHQQLIYWIHSDVTWIHEKISDFFKCFQGLSAWVYGILWSPFLNFDHFQQKIAMVVLISHLV